MISETAANPKLNNDLFMALQSKCIALPCTESRSARSAASFTIYAEKNGIPDPFGEHSAASERRAALGRRVERRQRFSVHVKRFRFYALVEIAISSLFFSSFALSCFHALSTRSDVTSTGVGGAKAMKNVSPFRSCGTAVRFSTPPANFYLGTGESFPSKIDKSARNVQQNKAHVS